MSGWHAPGDLVARYIDGSLPEPDAWSLEKHLEGCRPCAARVSDAARAGGAGPVLAQVRSAVLDAAPAPARPRAAGGRLGAFRGVPGAGRFTRVLWAAGPAVRGAWPTAVLLVAVGAVVLAYAAGFEGTGPWLLALSPVVPVTGVALSYGRHADPLHEIAAASPYGGLRLVLTRTVAVLAVSVPLLTVSGLLLPTPGPGLHEAPPAAAWLLPGLALTLASLVLSGYVGCRTATAVTGGGWLFALAVPVLAATGPTAGGRLTAGLAHQLSLCLTGAAQQGGWAAATVLCAALLAARRTAYDRSETM
ncbi:zf-HC2 domain-containing protein [Streptomyces sp. NPDC008313]|uniref:zf-HC2 domain-containing protein n=1 Tax=Streptomyces sp. NPDC008313 TaxID=3364826 RepID=UPI0036EEF7F2